MENDERPIVQSCYINGKVCRNGKRSDFEIDQSTGERPHCNKWVKLVGTDQQTGSPIDTWCCNEFAKTKLMIENSNMSRQSAASSDKVATEVAKFHATSLATLPDEALNHIAIKKPFLMPTLPTNGAKELKGAE